VLATETIVSFAGPAWAGAIDVAVSVAQMSNAVRKEAKTETITVRWIAENQSHLLANTRARADP